jgi:acetyl esterase/lipase
MNRISYGPHASQFGDLYRPLNKNLVPVCFVIHGGYWKDNHTLDSYPTRAIVDELLAWSDIAVWNLEYRRMEFEGPNTQAPWPTLMSDVADGIDMLRRVADEQRLDLARILVLGHSAGGHLAAWACGRANIAEESPLFRPAPLLPHRALVLSGILDLGLASRLSQPHQVERLLGGAPEQVPERCAAADPLQLGDLRIPMTLAHGEDDEEVPIALAESYVAGSPNPNTRLITLPGAGHFGMLPYEGVVPPGWVELKAILRDEVRALTA